MTVDPRLLTLIGKKLYSSNPLPIVVRELLQNARDACIRKGIVPRIYIEIIANSNTSVDVYVEDNGIGMTEEQLLNDFLCLGNTSKMDDSEAVGGFGIAKAALMRNKKWSVQSLDNFIDESYVYEGKDILKVTDAVDGTRISVHIDEFVPTWAFIQALQMIYLSEVDITLEAKFLHYDKFVDDHAGWHGAELTFKEEQGMWLARTFDKMMLVFGEHTSSELKGKTFVRLAGLLQFIIPSYGDRQFNIMIDLSPEKRPDDTDYPLTMSREGFSDSVDSDITELIRECDENPITAIIEAERLSTGPKIEIREGWLLRGKRNREPEEHSYDTTDTLVSHSIPKVRSEVRFSHQSLYLENYDEANRDIRNDIKILKVWREILLICADTNDPFGVGFKIHPQVNAARVSTEKGIHYVLNPDCLDTIQVYEAQIHFLHYLACHEVAHFTHSSHTEMHSNEFCQIYEETIQEVQELMGKLIRIIR
jgi:hypothetical protein